MLLSNVITSEAIVEDIRVKVQKTGFSLRSVFDQLDCLSRGYLTSNEFKRCFNNNEQDWNCLIKRFNKDKLNDRITLPEFLSEMTPKFN